MSLTGTGTVRQLQPHVVHLKESTVSRCLFGSLLARPVPSEDIALHRHGTEEHAAMRRSDWILKGVLYVPVKRVEHGYGVTSRANARHAGPLFYTVDTLLLE